MALAYAGIPVEIREISLKEKPLSMLAISPKATVPVLQHDKLVLEQSVDIMKWALSQHDPDGWLTEENAVDVKAFTSTAFSSVNQPSGSCCDNAHFMMSTLCSRTSLSCCNTGTVALGDIASIDRGFSFREISLISTGIPAYARAILALIA